jgi:hypothetical protein
MLKTIENILDSPTFQIVFAVWTGIYLVQVLKGKSGAPSTNELGWIGLAFVVGIFII